MSAHTVEMIVLQKHSGEFLQYKFASPSQMGKLNAAGRNKIHGQSWISYSNLNDAEKAQFRRKFRGGWEHGDKYKDPAEHLARMTKDSDGVYRWNTNNSVPPKDIMDLMGLDAEETNLHDVARDLDTDKFLAEYREAQSNRTPEQIAEEVAEARAALGPGVKLVNIVTGTKWTT
jgi:hypothetical protein